MTASADRKRPTRIPRPRWPRRPATRARPGVSRSPVSTVRPPLPSGRRRLSSSLPPGLIQLDAARSGLVQERRAVRPPRTSSPGAPFGKTALLVARQGSVGATDAIDDARMPVRAHRVREHVPPLLHHQQALVLLGRAAKRRGESQGGALTTLGALGHGIQRAATALALETRSRDAWDCTLKSSEARDRRQRGAPPGVRR